MVKRGAKKGSKYKRYSDAQKAMGLSVLKLCNWNASKAAREIGWIPMQTLRSWMNGKGMNADIVKKYRENKIELKDLFEQAAFTYLEHALKQEVVDRASGKDAMVTAATATDKKLLLEGKAPPINVNFNDEQRIKRVRELLDKVDTPATGESTPNAQPERVPGTNGTS